MPWVMIMCPPIKVVRKVSLRVRMRIVFSSSQLSCESSGELFMGIGIKVYPC